MRPVSTAGGTRCVQLVREGGEGGGRREHGGAGGRARGAAGTRTCAAAIPTIRRRRAQRSARAVGPLLPVARAACPISTG
jgi:hypothetical protein